MEPGTFGAWATGAHLKGTAIGTSMAVLDPQSVSVESILKDGLGLHAACQLMSRDVSALCNMHGDRTL